MINIHHLLDFSYIYQWLLGFRYQSYKTALSWCKFILSFYVFEMFWLISWHEKRCLTSPKSYKVCWNTFISKSIASYFRDLLCNSLWSVSLHQYKVFSMELWHNKRIGILKSGLTTKKKKTSKISISSFKK